jgi:hypothetical protein
MKERYRFEDLRGKVRITSKWILKNHNWCRQDSSGSGHRQVTGNYERSCLNENLLKCSLLL